MVKEVKKPESFWVIAQLHFGAKTVNED